MMGDVLMMLSHYFDPNLGGTPGKDFQKSSSFIKKIKFSLFENDLLDIDFSKMPVANWRYELQKLFATEVSGDFLNGYITKNPEQVTLTSDTPDKTQALELRLSRFDDPKAAQTFFYVALDAPTVTDAGANDNQVISVSIDSDPAKGGVGAYVNLTNLNNIDSLSMEAFWAPVNSKITINAKNLGTGAENSCDIVIGEKLTWIFEGPQDCTTTRADLQFLNPTDAVNSRAPGNQGRIPIHWANFQGALSNTGFNEASDINLNDLNELSGSAHQGHEEL
jgi:hypothetical protein